MSILETFYILFKTDADEATDGVKKLDAASDKLGTTLKGADAQVKALGSSFIGMARNFAAPLLSLASVAGAFNLAFSRIDAIDNIADAAGKVRSSAQDYDAFTRAVQSTGGSLAAASGDLDSFSNKLNDAAARPDGPNAKNFAKWGIMFKDAKGNAVGAVEGIVALAKSLEGLDQAEALGRIKRLGITDADTIAVLLEGKQALLDKMAAEKEAGVVTENQIRISGEYQAALGKSRNLLDSLGNNLMEMLIPAVTAGMGAFNRVFDFLLRHGRLVEGVFVGIAAVVTAVYLPAMLRAAATTLIAIAPFLAVAAAVAAVAAAFALAYEDVRAFMDGQPSLIGSLAERYEGFATVVRGIGDVFTWLGQEWGVFVNDLTSAWGEIETVFNAFSSLLADLAGTLGPLFQPLLDAWVNVASAVGDVIRQFSEFASGGESAAGSVTTAMDLVRAGVEAVGPTVVALAGIFSTVLGGAVRGIAALVDGIAAGVRAVAAAIAGMPSPPPAAAFAPPGVSSGAPAPVPATPGSRLGTMGGAIKNATEGEKHSALTGAQSSLAYAARAPQALASGPVTKTASNTVNVGDVTVHTQATDARGVAAAVRGALKEELRNTAAQFDDGVAT